MKMTKGRVLSGVQASGWLHLGNYHGAVENWVRLQDEYDCYFFIADWHSLTTLFSEPGKIREFTRDIMIDLLAFGLDPEKSTLFLQSDILQHAELAWLLAMLTPVPWLERVPTYKDKKNELSGRDLDSIGFLAYPVLQAADVSIYRASFVPVGEDQLPHLELTREIVRRFNHIYGKTLIEPKALLTEAKVLPGLDGKKMSKTYGNAVNLADEDETVRKKFMSAVTDPQRQRRNDPGRPEVCNIFAYHKFYAESSRRQEIEAECRTAGIGCVDCKKELIANFFTRFEGIRERRRVWAEDEKKVREIFDAGAQRARIVAEESMQTVRAALKIGWRP
jgi:tryptophanyl-tRNA synthetase